MSDRHQANDDIKSLLACPDCRAPIASENEKLICQRCPQIFERVGPIPSLFPRAAKVAVRYDIDWHPSNPPPRTGFQNVLRSLKYALEKSQWIRRAINIGAASIFYNVVDRQLSRLVRTDRSLILDVGVRNAVFTRHLKGVVIGVDVDVPSLKTILDQTSIAPVHAMAEHLPFRDRSFDIVFCSEVIEHVKEDRAMVAELARVTALHGTLLLTTPNGAVVPVTREIHHIHFRHYRAEDLRRLLEERYEHVSVRSYFIWPELIEAEARLYQRFIQKPSLWCYLLRSVLCVLETIFYIAAESWRPDRQRGYTLIATASGPRAASANLK